MKCKECKKLIPDGFTDCPWCGAIQPPLATPSAAIPVTVPTSASAIRPSIPSPFAPATRFASAAPADSSSSDRLTVISLLASGLLFLVLNYLVMLRVAGPLTLDNSTYFLGRCSGALILAAIVVFLYYKIRGQQAHSAVKLRVIFAVASLFTILALAIHSAPRISGADSAVARRVGDLLKRPNAAIQLSTAPTKWDPATRLLLGDVLARNQQYVSDVSDLDKTAKPLYTLESFGGPDIEQQMIAQLQARLAVAEKYADWQPTFAKMQEYVAPIDATDDEKHKFLTSYESTLPKILSARKTMTDKERAWLQSSIDLYQFALSKTGSYAVQGNGLAFKQRADSQLFGQKFAKAQVLNNEFLRAYWDSQRQQDAVLAQMGLQGSDVDRSVPR